jgi:hypothetical protein
MTAERTDVAHLVTRLDLPYTSAEAAARLSPFVARDKRSASADGRPLRGELSRNGFRVAAATSYRSSFSAWSEGTFTSIPGGCRLEYRTGTSAWSFLGIVFWFAMLFVIGYQRLDPQDAWWQLLTRNPDAGMLGLMLLFGVLIVGIGYALARRESITIDETLRKALLSDSLARDESRP